MPQPLPSNPYNHDQPGWRDAYDVCLRLEGATSMPKLVFVRFIGYMILEAPSNEARDAVSREINSYADDVALLDLAEFLTYNLLRFFRTWRERTPTPSDSPWRLAFTETEEFQLDEASRDHITAKEKALTRDGYQCILTRRFDFKSAKKIPRIQELNAGRAVAITQLAHIFSKSANVRIPGEHKYSASAWAVLEHFGGRELAEELNGGDINRLENIMTLAIDQRIMLGELAIWFKSTDQPNTYNIMATHNFLLGNLSNPVELTTEDPIKFPTPSPRYLHLHSACARMAHFSGGGEHIESILRETEEMGVLATDGSSSHVLNAVLFNARS